MQPLSSNLEQTSFTKLLSTPSDKLIETLQKQYYSGTLLGSIKKEEHSAMQISQTPNKEKLHPSLKQESYQADLPEILDPTNTQQNRERQAILKHTIETTIQQLLRSYKNTNAQMTPEQQQKIQNQIFERFAFIYSEMNQLKGDIEHTIDFLNQGTTQVPSQKQNLSSKKISLPYARITEKSQTFQESSEMKEEENYQRIDEEQISPNYGQASLEERYQSKPNQDSMEQQE